MTSLMFSLSQLMTRPRRLHRMLLLRLVVASFALGGCVPVTSYEQASSAAEVQEEAHRRTKVKYAAAGAQIEGLQSERDELKARLSETENRAAEGEMLAQKVETERDQQLAMVTQLRGELARAGDDLKSYAGEKGELAVRLQKAESHESELEARVAALEAQLAKTRSELSSSSKQSSELEAEKVELQQALTATKAELQAVKESATQTPDAPAAAPDTSPEEEAPASPE